MIRLASLLGLLVAVIASATPGYGAVSERPWRANAYQVSLEVDPATQTLLGTATVSIVVGDSAMATLELDCGELIIDQVSERGAPLTFAKRPRRLQLTPAQPWVAHSEHQVRVRYHGQQSHPGLRFFAGGWYTVFTTEGWLPCDADPAHKATLSLELTAPAGLKLYATGRRGERRLLPDGRQRVQFVLDQPYSTYLFGMAGGPFVERCQLVRGVTLCAAGLPERAAALAGAVDVAAQALAFFADRAGFAYPYSPQRYDQLFVPQTNVAQEMAGMSVLGARYLDDMAEDPHEDWAIVHELCHQWFGNWVTAASWTDFWLNEGLTLFMVAAAKEQRWGRIDYAEELALARRRYARALGKAPRPIVFAGWTAPEQMGGAITYSGGGLMLAQLRRELGDAAFWDGLRRFARAGAGRSVVTDDLRRAMEQASGRSLQPFFARWIYATAPALTATHRRQGATVIVELTQTAGLPLQEPVAVAVETARGRQRQRLTLAGGHASARFTVSDAPLLSVRVDDGGELPVAVTHERPIAMLIEQARREPDVAGRVDALTQLEQHCPANGSPPECAQMASSFAQGAGEPSRLVRELERALVHPAP